MSTILKARSGASAAMMILLLVLAMTSPNAFAHCDTLDGPVVTAATMALAKADVHLILPWVQKNDEVEIRRVFMQTLAVRKLSAEAKTLADQYFFETLVRIHRAGEGAPYTGLKPAGSDIGPAVPAADQALESGNVELLTKCFERQLNDGVRTRFKEVLSKKQFEPHDVTAGREFVRAYVEFVHYIEGIHGALHPAGHQHGNQDTERKASQSHSPVHQHEEHTTAHTDAHEK